MSGPGFEVVGAAKPPSEPVPYILGAKMVACWQHQTSECLVAY